MTARQVLDLIEEHRRLGNVLSKGDFEFLFDVARRRSLWRGTKKRSAPEMEWARVAMLAFEWLKATSRIREATALSMMYFRATIIDLCGAMRGDTLRDPCVVLEWIQEALPALSDAKLREIETWQTQDIELIRDLRYLKNRLRLVHKWDPSIRSTWPIVGAWLEVFDRLP